MSRRTCLAVGAADTASHGRAGVPVGIPKPTGGHTCEERRPAIIGGIHAANVGADIGTTSVVAKAITRVVRADGRC
jgi:hypothetical protein